MSHAPPPRKPAAHRRAGPQSGSLTTTADLLARARAKDETAVDELFARYLSPLRRWAHGRLPQWTRDLRDTDDMVQETLVQTLRRLDEFEPRHEGALQAYLRQALLNRVRDEIRRVGRRPLVGELPDEHEDPSVSPLEAAIGSEAVSRYEAALQRLRPEDRELIVARVEMGNSYQQIASEQGKSSADAARMAVSRAILRLAEEMDSDR